VFWKLVAPVVMMEHSRGLKAMKRSKELVRRSVWTTLWASMIMFLIPAVLAGTISFFINVTAKAFDRKSNEPNVETTSSGEAASERDKSGNETHKVRVFGVTVGDDSPKASDSTDMRTRVKRTLLQSVNQLVWLPIQIFVISFSAIIVALLYFKTRLSGGETTVDLMERFEDEEGPRRKWQERVRARLIQSGRVTSKS
jgi:hypothetical protein